MISMLMPMTCEIPSEASGKSSNFLDIDAINAPSTNTNQGDVRNYKVKYIAKWKQDSHNTNVCNSIVSFSS